MDRRIHGDGTAPARWESWLAERAERWAPDLVAQSHRLVVVAPHPDDELLMCAGLLQRQQARGGDCLVIAVTDGEASHRDVVDLPMEVLRATRRVESQEGLTRLGLSEVPVMRLELPDGDVQSHADSLHSKLLHTLVGSDLVVTTWRRDGHPDHEATGSTVAAVCAIVGCRLVEAPVWMWHWADPLQQPIDAAKIRSLALSPVEVAAKMRALECHRSQWTPRSPSLPAVLDAGVLRRSTWPSEYFVIESNG